MRSVWIDRPERNELAGFRNNRIVNSKYSIWTFLPLNLLEQFQRFMNRYFLLIACLQLIRNVAPVSPLTTWLPLLFIFAVTAVKEAVDDLKRHRADRLANSRVYAVIRGGLEMRVCSQDICVGDVVAVDNDSELPCDMVLLKSINSSTSSGDGCFIQTANIDGETDLKHRKVPGELVDLLAGDVEQLKRFYRRQMCIKCPDPNDHVYSFDSALEIIDSSTVVSLNSKNLLLQGTFLRNSGRVYGVAVYTGSDTKLGMNKSKPDIKLTRLDQRVDKSSIFVFVFQMLLVLMFGLVGNNLASTVFLVKHWYIEVAGELEQWYHYFIIPARMLLLFSLMIPISLKVTLDICKYFISLFIEWDLKMYDDETDEHCVASNTSIAEDLGQIQYIFTDKTGTLTENNMIFKKSSIDGRIYGRTDDDDISSDVALRSHIRESTSSNTARPVDHFFYCLTLCHSVMPNFNSSAEKKYIGTSPDEEALVSACSKLDFIFENRTDSELFLNVNGSKTRFALLKKLEFTSERKRMSVFVRNEQSGKIFLYSKGADDAILSSCTVDTTNRYKIEADIDNFARLGLRTLCVAFREIKQKEYDEWLSEFNRANASLDNREENILKCYSRAEQGLILLGATAIEDKLQEHAAYTITQLRSACIRVWMLTGDKVETAIQVARTSGLLYDTSRRSSSPFIGGDEVRIIELVHAHGHKTASELALDIEHLITELCDQRPLGRTSISITRFALVIDGITLRTISKDAHCVKLFFDLAQMATSVICCRVSPHQKSSIVSLMKQRDKVTLAIGDGGNDVAMIQMAHVGVGVRGKEGLQAVRAADYSISKFSYLSRLILIHGRYAYKRMAFIAIYCFYKSIYIGFLQALFEFYCGFSGTSFLNAFSLSLYNVVFTSLPIIFYVQDKDILESSVYLFPDVYGENVAGVFFCWSTFASWIGKAIVQAVLTFFLVIAIFNDYNILDSGHTYDELLVSMTAFTCAIVVQNIAVGLASNSLTWINVFLIVGSIISYFIITSIFSAIPAVGLTGVSEFLFNNMQFWLALVIVSVVTLLPDLIQKYYDFNYRTMFYQRIQMYEMDLRDRNVDVHQSDIALPALNISDSQSTNSRTPLTSSSSE